MENEGVSFKEKVFKGFAWLSAATFISQLVTWLSTLLVIRLLSPSDYGLMAMAGSFVTLIAMIGDLGFSAAIIQKDKIEENEIHQIFTLVIISNLCACALTYLTAPIVSWFYGEARLTLLIRFLSLNFVLSAFFMVPQSLMIREMDFRAKARVDMVSRVFSSLLTLAFAFCSMGVWSLALGEVCFYLLRAVGFNISRVGCLKPAVRLVGASRSLKFGLSIITDRFLYFLFSQSDIVIAGKFLGKDSLGVYAIALNLASIPAEKVMPLITQVSFTAYSRIQKDIERIRRNLLKTVRGVSFLSFPIFFGMVAAAPEGISVILGRNWENLIVPFQLLCLVLPIKTLSFLPPPAIFAVGKAFINVVNMAITVSAMSLTFLIGVRFGITGLCIGWVTVFPVVFLITTLRSLNAIELSFKDFVAAIRFPFVASSVMLLSLTVLRKLTIINTGPSLTLFAYIMTGVVIYTGLVVIFKAELFHELKALLKK